MLDVNIYKTLCKTVFIYTKTRKVYNRFSNEQILYNITFVTNDNRMFRTNQTKLTDNDE